MLDVEKQALLVLAHGLSACGGSSQHPDVYLAAALLGARREGEVLRRADGRCRRAAHWSAQAGYYTRIGPAVRQAAAQLARQPQRKKLLLVLTDGKPNDVDHYEGRFAVEDTSKAVRETRRQGIAVFDVTVDAGAQS